MVRNSENSVLEVAPMEYRDRGFYEKYGKRFIDIVCSLLAIVCFSWLFIILALMVRIKLGSPILFKQPRPGKNEVVFDMYKFRTMTNEKDANGNLLPDNVRLTPFGKWLRSTSLDELPELFNILNGSMSIIGPRPQLVRDMVFMSVKQRQRHGVTPGLSGLAQVNGRNNISWEEKIDWDLKYIQNISFLGDVKIVLDTVFKVVKKEDVNRVGTESDMDYGDVLLKEGRISQEEYDIKQEIAKNILNDRKWM